MSRRTVQWRQRLLQRGQVWADDKRSERIQRMPEPIEAAIAALDPRLAEAKRLRYAARFGKSR